MRIPFAGGPPEVLLANSTYAQVKCVPAKLWVLGEASDNQFVFSVLDPLHGRGKELKRVDKPAEDFSLSPDGHRIAVLDTEGRIQILDLTGDAVQSLVVKRKDLRNFQWLTWSSEGSALYVSAYPGPNSMLLHIDLQGNARVLAQDAHEWLGHPRVSPDGKHLAFAKLTGEANAVLVENF